MSLYTLPFPFSAVLCFLCLSFSSDLTSANTRIPITNPQLNAGSSVGQEGTDVQPLEPGKSIQRELKGGHSHSYQITCASGQYAQTVVEQKGIDVVVKLFGLDGKAVADLDRSNGIGGNESVEWIAETAGSYRLEVSAAGKSASAGRYEVKLEVLREPTQHDKDRTAALKAFIEARQLRSQGKKDSLEAALKKFNEALLLYRKVEERGGEAATLVLIGGIYSTLGDTQKALEQYQQALALR